MIFFLILIKFQRFILTLPHNNIIFLTLVKFKRFILRFKQNNKNIFNLR